MKKCKHVIELSYHMCNSVGIKEHRFNGVRLILLIWY